MSRLDDLVTDIATAYDDSTVQFQAGKLRIAEHAQKRHIIFVRHAGLLSPSTAPERATFSIAGFQTQIFEREETVLVVLRAEDEDALDAMLDRFCESVFRVCGANAFDDPTPYEWSGEDSQQAGQWVRRNPELRLQLRVRLRSLPTYAQPSVALEQADATLTELDASVLASVP